MHYFHFLQIESKDCLGLYLEILRLHVIDWARAFRYASGIFVPTLNILACLMIYLRMPCPPDSRSSSSCVLPWKKRVVLCCDTQLLEGQSHCSE
jgi:hypothetical protein